MKDITTIALVALLVLCVLKREKMVSPSVSFKETVTQAGGPWVRNVNSTVDAEMVKKLLILAQNKSIKLGKRCLYPIDTIYMHIYGDPSGGKLFKYRVIFFAQGHEMGFEVDAVSYLAPGSEEPVLFSVETDESATSEDPIQPYPTSYDGSYYSFDRIKKEAVPQLDKFNKYVNNPSSLVVDGVNQSIRFHTDP